MQNSASLRGVNLGKDARVGYAIVLLHSRADVRRPVASLCAGAIKPAAARGGRDAL